MHLSDDHLILEYLILHLLRGVHLLNEAILRYARWVHRTAVQARVLSLCIRVNLRFDVRKLDLLFRLISLASLKIGRLRGLILVHAHLELGGGWYHLRLGEVRLHIYLVLVSIHIRVERLPHVNSCEILLSAAQLAEVDEPLSPSK